MKRRRGGARDEARSLRGLDVDAHLRDPGKKQRYVTPMFDAIAPRYDQFTRVFSFGMDSVWKRELINRAIDGLPAAPFIIDVACGTGDIAFALASRSRGANTVGIDVSHRMLEAAEQRLRATHGTRAAAVPGFCLADMSRLPIGDATVDLVTSGYGLRNVPDHGLALRELARTLRPGGRLLSLDFFRPEGRAWRRLFLGYLSGAGGVLGWLWHREPAVYRYIARSIDHFVSVDTFSQALRDAGFEVEHVTRKLGGGIAIHSARRV